MPSITTSAGGTVRFKFTTRSSAEAPSSLSGATLSVYKDDSTTQSTAGVTLTVDFDSVTGLNHVAIDTSADGTFYANGSHFECVLTAGTVDSTSVAGEVVLPGGFDLAVSPAVDASGRVDVGKILGTASQGAAGYVGLDWSKINAPTSTQGLTGTTISSSQAVASVSGNVSGSVGSISGITFPTHFSSMSIDASGRVDVGSILGTASQGAAGYVGIDWAHITAPTSTVNLSGTSLPKVWDEVNTGATHNVTNSTGKQLRALSVTTSEVIYTATAPSQAGMTSTQIKLDSGASASDNQYQWDAISITSGTNAGDSRLITSYAGSTKVATVDSAWTVQPDNTSVFEITPTARAQVVSYYSGQDPATLVLDAVAASHNSASSIGAAINSIGGAVASVTGNVGGNVVGSVGSVTSAVTLDLTQALSAARALDAVADTSLTLNDAFHCAIAAAAGQEDASDGSNFVVKTTHTGTTLRTLAVTTSASNPFGSNYPVSRA